MPSIGIRGWAASYDSGISNHCSSDGRLVKRDSLRTGSVHAEDGTEARLGNPEPQGVIDVARRSGQYRIDWGQRGGMMQCQQARALAAALRPVAKKSGRAAAKMTP